MASSGNILTQLRKTDLLTRLIIVNVVVFVIFISITAIAGLYKIDLDEKVFSKWLALPASIPVLIVKPWTLITYMFYHYNFLHILFNMLWLYWMGRILQEYLGEKKVFSTYILGGICGGILFVAAYNFFPLFKESVSGSVALGASASVLAITVASATLLPDYRIGIFFFTVPLKYVALVTILIDVSNMSGNNAGGHIAHLGGALYGFFYIRQLRRGKDFARGFNKMIDGLVTTFSGRPRMKVKYSRAVSDEIFLQNKKAKEERIDEILDKISQSGYGSLSQEEKDFLFKSTKE